MEIHLTYAILYLLIYITWIIILMQILKYNWYEPKYLHWTEPPIANPKYIHII